jgi:hypothetical protein
MKAMGTLISFRYQVAITRHRKVGAGAGEPWRRVVGYAGRHGERASAKSGVMPAMPPGMKRRRPNCLAAIEGGKVP